MVGRDAVSPREELELSAPTARLFVGTWPPPEVVAVLSSLERPSLDAVRWTTADQWHVTLAFLGDVALTLLDDLATVLLTASTGASAPEAHLGPATRRVGRSVLCVPVGGLDALAGTVRRALSTVLPAAGLDEPFHGHLTLARGRGRRPVPGSLAGARIDARWRAREVDLVRSEPGPSGARYTTLLRATVPS